MNSSAPAALVGKRVLFNTRSRGGSVWGVVPVGKNWNVEYMNIAYNGGSHCTVNAGTGNYECTYTTRSTAVTNGECPLDGADYSAGNRETMCVRSDAGVSDVEPAMFVGNNLPSGWTALSATELASLTVNSEYGVAFGIAVTDDVYASLQLQQGLAANEVPSLTKSEIAGILRGDIRGWRQLDANLGGISSVPNSAFMSVCRRANGSGTQASQNAYFFNAPCASAVGVADTMIAAAATSATYRVVENSSTGNVVDCLNRSFNGGLNTTSPTLRYGGIGFMALERQPSATDRWKFIKIGGVEPTIDNVVSTAYDHVFEQTIQWQSSLSGDKLAAAQMVLTASGDPAVLNGAGVTGVVALQANGNDWNDPADYPTTRGTRGGNSCAAFRASRF
jgi:hypothetical protein